MLKLKLKHLGKNYLQNGQQKTVIKEIDLEIKKGEFICIVGPSGCGKTTLLKIIGGLIPPDSGAVYVDGQIIKSPSPKIGIVFQELALFPWLTALDNVKFPLESQGFSPDKIIRLSEKYLELVGLGKYQDYFPSQLSGGMNQRVAIARALVFDPEILLLDEPLASLDTFTRSQLQEELLLIWKMTRKTIVFVTHNIEEAVFLGQRVVVLSSSPGTVKKTAKISLPSIRNSKIKTSSNFNSQRRLIEEMIL